MSIIQKTIDKLTTGNKMQYILVGTLILVIVLSLLSVFLAGGKKNRQLGSGEQRYKCEECEKEFTMKPKSKGRVRPDVFMRPAMCPDCKTETRLLMQQCPNPECKKWFVREITPEGLFCTHCDTNIFEWQMEQRQKK